MTGGDGGKPGRIDAFDVSDENPQVIARHLRLIQSEMRAGFESIRLGLDRIHERLDDIAEDVAELRASVVNHEKRIRALESAHAKKGRKA